MPFLRSPKLFHRDQSGAAAVIFGLSFIVLMLAVAIALDSSRRQNVATKVQLALDAATLAAAKTLDEEGATDEDVRTTASAFLNSRKPEITMDGLVLGDPITVIDRANSTVTMSMPITLPSIFGRVAGLDSTFNYTETSSATYRSLKIELALVLDITGSMAPPGKINALKSAAKDLVDSLFAANPQVGAVRVALVPYSASVNAGTFYEAITNGGSSGTWSGWSSWSSWNSGASDTCVVERTGANAFTEASPSSGGYLGTSSSAENTHYSCPTPTIVPLSDLADETVRSHFKSSIDALNPSGATAGHIGAAWGWYMLSPSWSSLWPSESRPKPYSDDVMKAVILMTDGEFNTSYKMANVNSTDYSAQGSSGYQALQLCDGMKGQNITIYTIGFMAPAAADNMLTLCSGEAHHYSTATSGQLVDAFRDIVNKLTSLRISS